VTVEQLISEGREVCRIETPRLILRMFEEEDFDRLYEINRDPETFRFSERGPLTTEEAWVRLLRNIGHWIVKGYGLFAVQERQSGQLIGEAGLADFRRQLGARFDGAPEATWTIAPSVQGQGYATEAMNGVLKWAKDSLDVRRTVCLIHSSNEPSLKVAEKLGYRSFRQLDYKGYPALLLEQTR
jgi:RimJ/RimL family protein N-acetyltransferase